MRIRLDYELRGYRERYYTLLPGDANGALAACDKRMHWLEQRQIPATLYALDSSDKINKEAGIIGGVEKAPHGWECWREGGLLPCMTGKVAG